MSAAIVPVADILVALHASTRPTRLALRMGEAAEALGVSPDYFAARIAPQLRIVRDGRTKLVPVMELTRWLDENSAYAIGRAT